MAVAWPLTVFVDAGCPLCAAEVAVLVPRDTAGLLRFADCALYPDDATLQSAGLTRADLLRALHARDAGGQWLRGIDVFAAAYGAAGLRWQAWLLKRPRLRPLFDAIYRWVAPRRALLARWGGAVVVRAALGGIGAGGAGGTAGAGRTPEHRCANRRCRS